MRHPLIGLAWLTAAASSWGATCTQSTFDVGTLVDGQEVAFGASCTGVGLDPDDPDTWTFTHEVNFTMARAGTIGNSIGLGFQRGERDEITRMLRIDPIYLVHDGVATIIGGEGQGYNEVAHYFASDLAAGDYTLRLPGQIYALTTTDSGFYTGALSARYDPIAAPVPEPATLALLAAGAPLLAWRLRRRTGGAAHA